jgi:hypothetical protein
MSDIVITYNRISEGILCFIDAEWRRVLNDNLMITVSFHLSECKCLYSRAVSNYIEITSFTLCSF